MEISLSAPIAIGRTAEVFAWDEAWVLKLYNDWCPPQWVEAEARVARAIYKAGIPSPAPGEVVEVNGRRGLIYERLDGISMLQDMNARPWMLFQHARSLAELQVRIHKLSIPGLGAYRDDLGYAIQHAPGLSDDLRARALVALERLPDGQALCHGDYHPGNVLITERGPIVIDWMTAQTGSFWADVARTNLLLLVGVKGAGKQVSSMVRVLVGLYRRLYLGRYLAIVHEQRAALERWMPVMAAARLNEAIEPERAALVELVEGLQA